jgi:hypothetical protein
MQSPPCTLTAEVARLEVGHGIARIELVALLAPHDTGCDFDASSVLRAREEGRAGPEIVAAQILLDADAHVRAARFGPRARIAVEVPPRASRVRVLAIARGDRFVAVPLSIDPAAVARPVEARLVTTSVWGSARVAGVARWVERGAPIVIETDPTRDRERASSAITVRPGAAVPALIVDGGPRFGEGPSSSDRAARLRALARGGLSAAEVLLVDLPSAIAAAADARAATVVLDEAAIAARAAAGAADPLIAAAGQRLSTAIATGFRTCARSTGSADDEAPLPASWPRPDAALVSTGLLDDPDAGCPRLRALISANHPELRLIREAGRALDEAAALPRARLPAVEAGVRRPTTRTPGRSRWAGLVLAVGWLFVLAITRPLSNASRPR